MPFNNPIVGGTALIRQAIKSPNYVTGSAGWSINRDGSAEFNSAVFRGSLNIGGNTPGTSRLYITPNLPPPLNTFDFTPMIPLGVGPFTAVFAEVFYIGTPGDSYQFVAMVHNSPVTVAAIVTGSVNAGTMVTAGGVPLGTAQLFGGTLNNTNQSNQFSGLIQALAGGQIQANGLLALNTGGPPGPATYGGNGDFQIDGRCQPRGTIAFVASTANVSVVSPANNTILQDPLTTAYRSGGVFKVTFGGVFAGSVATTALVGLYDGSNNLISGATRFPIQLAATQDEHKWITYFCNNTGADEATSMQVKMQPAAGTLTAVHAARYPFTFEIEQVGAFAPFTGATFPLLPSL